MCMYVYVNIYIYIYIIYIIYIYVCIDIDTSDVRNMLYLRVKTVLVAIYFYTMFY